MGRLLERILLVDDDEDMREMTRLVLEMNCFAVETCLSGRSAVERAARFRPDLIMLDVNMPDLDGPATLAALKKDGATAAIPVVFVTAGVQRHEREALSALPCLGVIAKPYDAETLLAQLEAAWEKRGPG